MNKNEFIDAIALKTELTKKDIATVIDAYHDTIADELKSGEKVSFVGFGTYEAKKRAARTGRNPQTGESMTIPASTSVGFKAGKGLKDKLN